MEQTAALSERPLVLTQFVGIKARPEQIESLDRIAAERGVNRSALIREAIDGLLERSAS